MRPLIVVLLLSGRVYANKHVVSRGETLEHVAAHYGCTVKAVLAANRLDTTLVPPGTIVRVPKCAPKSRARGSAGTGDDAFRARRALAVIDGTTLTAAARDGEDDVTVPRPASVKLRDAERLPLGEGYRIRRPSRAYGAPHVVEHLRAAIAIVRALYPDVHTLAIGDLSAEHGGKLANHLSHQTGLDVDLGFYFHQVPAGYPDRFVAANADLDLAATWSLLTAFARTSHLGDGVHMMFLDYGIQARLYAWARKRGTPDDQLAVLLQYPRGSDTLVGLVRHWPNHADHLHVRFKAAK